MSLSKARDRERKRKGKVKFQPNSNLNDISSKTFGYATRDVPEPKWMVKDGN